MKKKNLIIYGIGRFAEYVRFVFDNDSEFTVTGFCIEKSLHKELTFRGLPLEVFEDIPLAPNSNLFIAVGRNDIRKRIFQDAKAKGFKMTKYISSKATVWPDLKIGENSFISEGCVIQPFVSIGDNSIHFGSRIGHHSVIREHTLLSNSTLGGNVSIGEETYLGMNSVVQQNVRVAPRNLVGMNVSIDKDTAENSVFTNTGSNKRDVGFDLVEKKFLQ